MAKFLDGPAAGVTLQLRRAPVLLRAVGNQGGDWDALDQLDDTPDAGERIAVYIQVAGTLRRWHQRPGGCYEGADYRLLAPQPADELVRSTDAWRKWCFAQRDVLVAHGHKDVVAPVGAMP